MTGSPALADEPEDAAVKDPSGQLTEIIPSALGLAAKAARPQWPDDTDEIQAITDAMVRLLPGVHLRSDGQLTIKSLAEQAGLKRNKLTDSKTCSMPWCEPRTSTQRTPSGSSKSATNSRRL
jgi:hypothetical protein